MELMDASKSHSQDCPGRLSLKQWLRDPGPYRVMNIWSSCDQGTWEKNLEKELLLLTVLEGSVHGYLVPVHLSRTLYKQECCGKRSLPHDGGNKEEERIRKLYTPTSSNFLTFPEPLKVSLPTWDPVSNMGLS